MRRNDPFPLKAVASAGSVSAATTFPAFLVGAMAIRIGPDLGFTATGTGIAVGIYMAASALGGPALGGFVERLGSVRAIRIATGMTVFCLLSIATLAHSWNVLVGILALGGLGNACGQMASNLTLAEASTPDNDGLAFGLKQAAVPLSTMVAGLSVPLFVAPLSWRWAFVFGAGLVLTVFLAAPGVAEASAPKMQAFRGRPGMATKSGINPLVIGLIVTGAFLASGVGISLAVFIVEYAVSVGWSSAAAGTLLGACSIAALAARAFAGVTVDARVRRGGSSIVLIPAGLMMAGGAVGTLVIMFGGTTPHFLVVGAVLSFALGWGWPGLMHLTVVSMDRQAVASSTGLILLGVFGGGVVIPMILGVLTDRKLYAASWLVSAAFLGLAAVAFITARLIYRKQSRTRICSQLSVGR